MIKELICFQIKIFLYSFHIDIPYNFTKANVDINGQMDQAVMVSDLFKDQVAI